MERGNRKSTPKKRTHIGEKKGKTQKRKQQHTQAMTPGLEEVRVTMLRWHWGQMQLVGRRPNPGGKPSCWMTTTTGGPPTRGGGIPGEAV